MIVLVQREGVFQAHRTDGVLLLVALVWGSSYLAAKSATDALPVVLVLFARYALSALACLVFLAAGPAVRRAARPAVRPTCRSASPSRDGGGSRRPTATEVRCGAVLGVTQAAVLVLETYGVAHTSAANAGLIISLTIVLTPVLDRRPGPGGRRGPPPAFFAAAGVCVLAVALLMSGTGIQAPRVGDLLMVAAAVVRAAHVALVGWLTARHALRPAQLTAGQTVVGSVLFLVPAAGALPTLAHAGAATWGQLLYLALFCSVFAFLAQTWAVQRTSASRASLLLGTEPVWAAAVGVGLGGERLTPLAALGAALMVTGTYWGQSVERAHRTVAGDPATHRHPHAPNQEIPCPTTTTTSTTTTSTTPSTPPTGG
ncbi:DMT family transporter [Streptomyces sp. B6B3]|uniref:DMT family transporter n=1 Tax=Streptomyces sp. B6B3 TaxID=3153570 RepID=UPI00325C5E6F